MFDEVCMVVLYPFTFFSCHKQMFALIKKNTEKNQVQKLTKGSTLSWKMVDEGRISLGLSGA